MTSKVTRYAKRDIAGQAENDSCFAIRGIYIYISRVPNIRASAVTERNRTTVPLFRVSVERKKAAHACGCSLIDSSTDVW